MSNKSDTVKLFFMLVLVWQYTEAAVRVSLLGVPENFAKFTGQHLCLGPFLTLS